MEEAYGNLNAAYLQIKGMVVIEGFYALVAGFVITTFIFHVTQRSEATSVVFLLTELVSNSESH